MEQDEESRKFYDLKALGSTGEMVEFSEFIGHPLIIVNVASLCGLTDSNYENLAKLVKMYHKKGLRVLVFPCNQYLKQEPGPIHEIQKTVQCYSSMFILFDKVDVFGKDIHPVFKHLTDYSSGFLGNYIKWNFTKFLVNGKGKIVKRYSPNSLISETDQDLIDCMEELPGSERMSVDKDSATRGL